jgi:hypothetical protein
MIDYQVTRDRVAADRRRVSEFPPGKEGNKKDNGLWDPGGHGVPKISK